MRIAQVAPLYERVPPLYYGGTERIVSYLTEELIKQGHDLTLFASGDSITKARLIAPCDRSLRLDSTCEDRIAYHFLQLEQVFQNAASFDIIHFPHRLLTFSLSPEEADTPHLTTLHGRLDLPDLVPLYRQFADIPLVSISNQHKELFCLGSTGKEQFITESSAGSSMNAKNNQGAISPSWEGFLRRKESTEPLK